MRKSKFTEEQQVCPIDHRAYVLNHVDEAKSKVTSWNYDPGDRHPAEAQR